MEDFKHLGLEEGEVDGKTKLRNIIKNKRADER